MNLFISALDLLTLTAHLLDLLHNYKNFRYMISEKIFQAGVVGAGGAGFPTHIKANSKVEFVLANGAECEPLIHKDYELMLHFSAEIIRGMKLLIESTSAKQGYFGIKEKNYLDILTLLVLSF